MTELQHGPVRNAYDKYGTQNPVEKRLMDTFLGKLDLAIRGLNPRQILEVGAGEGEIAARLQSTFPRSPVVAMDLPDGETASQWSQRGVTGFFGDMRQLPFVDKSVDLVLGIEVLEHVPDPELALAEIARVCRGVAVMSVPREPIWRVANMARGKYLDELGNTPGHINHWSRRGFVRFVEQSFRVDWAASPFPWTMVRAIPKP